MSSNVVEWLAVTLFFICFFGFSLLESFWLNKKNLVPFPRAFSFSFVTNILSVSVGFFVSFAIFAVLLMLAFGGTLQELPPNDPRIWTAVTVAALFPLLLLILAKRLMLRLFKLVSVGSPWTFSIAASVAFLLTVSTVPSLFIYFSF
jgi:hypothetical protein